MGELPNMIGMINAMKKRTTAHRQMLRGILNDVPVDGFMSYKRHWG
jgi:hypothetical protein